ncbi:MAG: bifunctional isocitrate dehydrogenase kinase/phosphatase [Acidimicrobiia bacterium]|nr:bifunctional isocitrate dehydrogenase kinase/phosphatase [Acidimicrobiia bacterium]
MHETGARAADVILSGFDEYRARFDALTAEAAGGFVARAWPRMLELGKERLDVYNECVDAVVNELKATVGEAISNHDMWSSAKQRYGAELGDERDRELGETFFNSATRRIFHTEGINAAIEFVTPVPTNGASPAVRHAVIDGDCEGALDELLRDAWPMLRWVNLRRDVTLAADELRRRLALHALDPEMDEIELLAEPFYRGQSAFLVGRVIVGDAELPLGIVVHHTARGLVVGAVLAEVEDLSVVFSYTRSSFLVATRRPAGLVGYLRRLMPHKRPAELYTTIGFHKHGKTELYRDFMQHVADSDDQFVYARGIKGMVMIVFTMPGYDVVFKVIRDRFPFPKQTTRRQIMSKYRLVFRHDRAGRMIEAYEFEHLQFDRDRFSSQLLEELAADATRSVTVDGDQVTLHHVYVERRVIPLDVYVREANPIKAQAAIVDYGRAIKNLAATNIFPGDMLLKNFGVTRSGRVVFYDYDEITTVTSCKFRDIPESDRPDQEMSADPWFGVGENDVFPEEFTRFLGIRDELRNTFDYHHSDLFTVRFWRRAQDRVRTGEVIEVFPYRRSRRLRAVARSRLGAVE